MSLGSALSAQSLMLKQAIAEGATVPTLQLAMSIELGAPATEALQAGLMLAFDVDWQLDDGRELHQSLVLRYSPLLRSYQLAIGNGHPQTFALRNALLAAMENAQLRWPDASACAAGCGGRVRVRLDPAQLPAPLRLPALFDGDWSFDSGWREVESGSLGTRHGARDTAGWAKLAASSLNGDIHDNPWRGAISGSSHGSRAPRRVPHAPLQRYS